MESRRREVCTGPNTTLCRAGDDGIWTVGGVSHLPVRVGRAQVAGNSRSGAQMLKKAKKSRRGATSSQVRAVASEGSPCGPLGVPSSLDAAHGKSTPEALGDSDEEGDAFL
ncbi:unnamed protein product [Heligmosomoides polygyrus]|uniref:Uncharacterized protein n=1 Tax=Heligmosomoides polygyrus TaxID=6339 RepID=A0A183F9H3_HELPZ|nr:unnamed protein product [Heligmosomoides polygyrus]